MPGTVISPESSPLLRAYATLDRTTPLAIDCGLLCDHRCCKGDDDSGMLLLPGEELLLKDEEGYRFLHGGDETLLICSGTCRRHLRPFACRIFPLFPVVTPGSGDSLNIRLITDPRGFSLCPLAYGRIPLHGIFRYLVRRATRILLEDPPIAAWLLKHSNLITALEEVRFSIESRQE